MLQLRPHKRKSRPQSCLRRAAYVTVESPYFDAAISLTILVNIVSMTLTSYGESEQHTATLAALNLCFSAIFAVEAALKLLAYFPRQVRVRVRIRARVRVRVRVSKPASSSSLTSPGSTWRTAGTASTLCSCLALRRTWA